jgi:hypothetical protein
MLTALTSLEELQFYVPFNAPGTLSVLAALTQLKRLELPTVAAVDMPTPADVAAAMASTQLTYLDLSDSHCLYPQHRELFPSGRQLPHLVQLHVSLGMTNGLAGKAAAACCPNLQDLLLYPKDIHPFGAEAGLDEEAFGLSSMLEAWQPVVGLTALTLDAGYTPMHSCVWVALGALTQLRELIVVFMGLPYISGILHLGKCRFLEELLGTGSDLEPFVTVQVAMAAKVSL